MTLNSSKAGAAAVELLYSGDISAACRGLSNKARKDDIIVCINHLTVDQVDEVAEVLHTKIKCALDALIAVRGENSRPRKAPQAVIEAATYIKSVVCIIKILLDCTKANIPPVLTSIVFELHDNGLLAISGPLAVQEAVAKLLIDYWLMEAPKAAEIVVQLGPFLLWRAVEGKAADVKRLHVVREAFGILDLQQPESQDTVNMILSACITPSFLRCAEGKRTLAYFFGMDADLARRLVRAMKGQICVGKSSMMDAFGEILFKAWQIRSEQSQEHIEGCIQQLMQDAIMAKSTQMSVNMRKVLNYLHEQRRFQGVGNLLHRLYEPILWCHLKAAHFQVRLNALGILLEAFPIQDTAGQVATEDSINMQLTHVMKALRDPNADVRAAAAWGSCELLTSWWELLPGQAISRIMVLLQDTAFDADAPKVRMALIEGLGMLVDNPLAQQSMALLLPNLRWVMFDANLNVRVRMASLVMRVSQIKTFEWWNIFPVAELLSVMAKDCDAVAKTVQAMLFSQYIDCGASSSLEGCVRLLQLLRDNTCAGVAFCKFLAQQAVTGHVVGVSLDLIASWSTLLTTYLIECRIGERSSMNLAAAACLSGSRIEEEGQTSVSQGTMKRPRAIETSEIDLLEDVESADEWTSLLAGLHALLIPLHEGLQRAAVSETSSDTINSRKGKGKARGCTDKVYIMQPQLQPLAPHALVSLLEKAPSFQAAQVVLSIACSTFSTTASEHLCRRCLDNFQGGYLYLPGVKHSGKSSVSIQVNSIPRQASRLSTLACLLRHKIHPFVDTQHKLGSYLVSHLLKFWVQGRLSGSHVKSCSVICYAVDLALKCKPQEFVPLLADTLTGAEGLLEAKRRRGRNKLVEVHAPKLNVPGALGLLAMATRDESGQRLMARYLQQGNNMDWIFALAAQFVSRLDEPKAALVDQQEIRNDALLMAKVVFIVSALACEARVKQGVSACESIQSHAVRICDAIINNSKIVMQPVGGSFDIAEMCSDLIEKSVKFAVVSKDASKKKATVSKVTRVEVYTAHPQATLLRIVCDAVYDLAVAANTAVDVAEELSAEGNNRNSAVDICHPAADACKMVWQALQQLLALHRQLFNLKVVEDVEIHELNHDCVDVAICTKLGVQAIFRGMGLFHVDGNLASLLKGVGTHLAIFNSTCRCRGASVDSKAHLADLASASLTGCIYVDASTDAADRVFTLTQTSMRSHQQAEEAMGMLIKPSVLMLGYQQQQSERCTNLSACDWLVDSLGSSDLDVAEAVRATVAAQLKKWMHMRYEKEELESIDDQLGLLIKGSQAAIHLLDT